MIKTKNTQLYGKYLDRLTEVSNQTMCSLCNLERLYIANANNRKILNKKNELVTQCPHYPREYFSLFLIALT